MSQGIKAAFVGNLGQDPKIEGDKVKLNVAVRMSAEHTEWVGVTAWPTKNGGGLDYLGKGKKGDRVVILGAALTTKPGDNGKVWFNASVSAMDVTIIPKTSAANKADDGDLPF